jgi:hypothetical protein
MELRKIPNGRVSRPTSIQGTIFKLKNITKNHWIERTEH